MLSRGDKSYSIEPKQALADVGITTGVLTTELLRVVPALVGELLPDQLYSGDDADELSAPDELSGEESNEEMEALLVAAALVLRLGWGESARPRADAGAGVEAVDEGIEGELE